MVNYVPNAINYMFTNDCDSACDICGVRGMKDGELSLKDITKNIDEASKIGIEEACFCGGEVLLRKDDLLTCIEKAKKNKMKAGIVTNASYASSIERGYVTALELKRAGLSGISFSLDMDHQKHIPYDNVLNAVKGAISMDIEDIGLKTSVRSTNGDDTYALVDKLISDLGGHLEQIGDNKIIMVDKKIIGYSPEHVRYVGGARDLERKNFEFKHLKKCEDFCETDELVILNTGSIVPCCSFYSCFEDSFSVGNIKNTSLKTAVSEINKSFIDLLISPDGKRRIINFLEKTGDNDAKKILNKKYTTLCGFCEKIHENHSLLETVESEFQSHFGLETKIIYGEGSEGAKTIDIEEEGKLFDLKEYMGPISNRDFWTGLYNYELELLSKNKAKKDNSKILEVNIEDLLNRAKNIPKYCP